MDEQLKSNLTSSKHWLRLVYMLLFAVFLQVALAVMWVLVVIQFLFALITGNDNGNLRNFGHSLSRFIFQAIQFLTYNSEEKPFPFADWPEAENLVDSQDEVSQPTAADQEPVSVEEETPASGADGIEGAEDSADSTEPQDHKKVDSEGSGAKETKEG